LFLKNKILFIFRYINLPCNHGVKIDIIEELFKTIEIGLPECPNCSKIIGCLPRFKTDVELRKTQIVSVFDAYFALKTNLNKFKLSLMASAKNNLEHCDNPTFKKYVIDRCEDKTNILGLAEAQVIEIKVILLGSLKFTGSSSRKILDFLQDTNSDFGPEYLKRVLKYFADENIQDDPVIKIDDIKNFASFSKGSWSTCTACKKPFLSIFTDKCHFCCQLQ
jgi:hypothetical protein